MEKKTYNGLEVYNFLYKADGGLLAAKDNTVIEDEYLSKIFALGENDQHQCSGNLDITPLNNVALKPQTLSTEDNSKIYIMSIDCSSYIKTASLWPNSLFWDDTKEVFYSYFDLPHNGHKCEYFGYWEKQKN